MTSNKLKCYKLYFFSIFKDYGKGYAWSQPYLTINTGDSVKWSWQPPVGITGVAYQVVQVQDAVSYSPIGFSSKYLAI